ncbi:MAG: hypothetical protein K8R88_01205 [Armatimonadetes bacterium]|nr:hypothetical protein [Armatimonadota bacterium]
MSEATPRDRRPAYSWVRRDQAILRKLFFIFTANTYRIHRIACEYHAITFEYRARTSRYKPDAAQYKAFVFQYKTSDAQYNSIAAEYNPDASGYKARSFEDFVYVHQFLQNSHHTLKIS